MNKRMLILGMALVLLLCGCQSKHTFTVEKWQDDPGNRVEIVDDFLDRYDLVGMSPNKVISLLGEPDMYNGFVQDDRLVYRLGIKNWLAIDNSWLLIDFADGVVADYTITTD